MGLLFTDCGTNTVSVLMGALGRLHQLNKSKPVILFMFCVHRRAWEEISTDGLKKKKKNIPQVTHFKMATSGHWHTPH